MTDNTEITEPTPAVADDTLVKLAAKIDTLIESEDSSIWKRFYPRDIPFFKLALLNKFQSRAYHTVSIEGPLELKRLLGD